MEKKNFVKAAKTVAGVGLVSWALLGTVACSSPQEQLKDSMKETSEQLTKADVLDAEKRVDESSLNRIVSNLSSLANIYIDFSTKLDTLKAEQQRISLQPNNAKAMYQVNTRINQITSRLNQTRRSQQSYLQQYTELLVSIDMSIEEIKKVIKVYERALKNGNKAAAQLWVGEMVNLFSPGGTTYVPDIQVFENPMNPDGN